jgi:virginiamycin B lyase
MLELPNQRARPRRLAVTSDDLVWYVDYARGFLARLDPTTGAIREWAAPGGAAALPYAMTVDDADRLWFVETGPRPNRLVGFDSRTELFFSVTAIPSGGGSVRHMVFHRPTRTIWFGTDANTIGRAHVP